MNKKLNRGDAYAPILTKLSRIMRLMILMFILGINSLLAASGYSQSTKITLKMSDTRVEEVLNRIESKSEFFFLFNQKQIDINRKVSIEANDEKISDILDELFAGTDVKHQVIDRQIVLTTQAGTEYQQQQQGKKIIGKVTDANGTSLPGVSVVVKGSTLGITTDNDGFFTLVVPKDAKILTFSFVGMRTQEISVEKKTMIKVVMEEESIGIEEVVAIGYGTLDKKELTSAVSHISSKDFLNVSSVDPSMMIQGKVAGVSITNTAAADPNNQASIQIRGITSRAAGLGPLIVIDGVPGGNLTNINSNDIASMDILKDGAASAIYGTRGSNGVILITTQKGSKDGKVHTSYNNMISASIPYNELELLSAEEYRKYRTADNPALDFGGSTDWIDKITRTGFTQQHTLTLSAGDNKSNYRASADYRDATGIDIRSGREEYGGRVSVNHATNSGLLNISLNIAPRVVYRKNSSLDAFKWAADANPTTPVFDPENPSLYYDFTGQQADVNPLELLKLEDDGGETKLLDWDGTVKLNLLPLLAKDGNLTHSLNTQITFANQQSDDFNYFYRPSKSRLAITNGYKGEASRSYSKYRQHSLEWIGNYGVERNGHKIGAIGGYSYQYFQNSGMSASNKDFASDALTYNNLGSGEWANVDGKNGIGSYKNDAKLIAFFGRLSYDYKGRYMATASLRYEGSSKFGANNKWGYFPAVSAGWRISEESFMKGVKWINDFKLRADYGVTGNQNFANYLSLATMTGFGSYYYNGNWFTVWGLSKNPNPDLKWEKGKNWNIGIDFSFINNILSGSVNYYNRRQQDLLGDYTVAIPPAIQETTFVNVGTMLNSGIEFDLNISALKVKNFSYVIGLVGATNENKFLSFSNSNFTGSGYYDIANMESPNTPGKLQRIQEGERIGNYFTWAYAGIDKDGDWVVWNKGNTEMIKIGDAKEEDKRITGNGLPKFTASMTNTFTYKNWGMTIFFRGAFEYDIFNVHDFYYGLPSSQGNVIKKAYSKNASITKGKNVLTDYFIENGDYVKLDMITLSHSFKFRTKWIERARLYVTGKNLATYTGFSGVDPSTYQTNGLTSGVNLMDNSMGTRRYYPSATQIIFGAQIDF